MRERVRVRARVRARVRVRVRPVPSISQSALQRCPWGRYLLGACGLCDGRLASRRNAVNTGKN